MAAMECKAFLGQLDSWIEGEKPSEARAHVAGCSSCRALVEDLSAITFAARITAEKDPEPPAYLWNSIRSQLENEGVIRQAAVADCDAFIDQLDSWMNGVRPAEAREHLAGCRNCRSLADDFTAISVTARSLADEADPPAYLWNSIRAQLEHEGIIREPRAAVIPVIPVLPKPGRSWFGLPRPAFASAFAAVVLLAGLAVRGPLTQRINDYRWMQGTQQSTAPLTAQLDTVEHATVVSFRSNPVVEAALHKNLAIVDNYIALCEKSVREDPQSEMARDFLYDAYQQKADLLAQMTEQQGMNDQGE